MCCALWQVPYDVVVVAVGERPATLGVPGVTEVNIVLLCTLGLTKVSQRVMICRHLHIRNTAGNFATFCEATGEETPSTLWLCCVRVACKLITTCWSINCGQILAVLHVSSRLPSQWPDAQHDRGHVRCVLLGTVPFGLGSGLKLALHVTHSLNLWQHKECKPAGVLPTSDSQCEALSASAAAAQHTTPSLALRSCWVSNLCSIAHHTKSDPALLLVVLSLQHAYFMKEVMDTVRLRKRISECFELASLPRTTEQDR